ncbi:MAG: tetratricopeptide repeat protein [Flectobacillus sp.]|uniref:tetratricopeptide repeat protein n=1 Tax=Flectobacillus sp. TaxID=50419 RepID=UPI003B98EF8C
MKKLPSIVFLSVAASCTVSGYEMFAQSTLNYNEANIHFRNGQEYYESKSFEAARAEFELYLSEHRNFLDKNDPNQAWSKYFIVMCSLYLDRADTELLADRFVREHPEHPVAGTLFREIGNYFFENGDYGKAIDYLSKTSKADEESQYHLGVAYYQTQSYSQALTVFTRLRDSQTPAYGPPSAYYAGAIQFQNKNYDEAIKNFGLAENSPQYKAEIPGWIANAYYRQGKYNEMLEYTEKVLREKGRKLDDIALLTAEVYFNKGNYEKASTYYGIYKNYKSQGMMPVVAYRYGYSLYKTNQFSTAVDQLKNVALPKDTLGQNASFVLGICYQRINNLNGALGAFDMASKMSYNKPVQEEASFNVGKVLLDLGRSPEAVKSFEGFLAQYPNSRFEDEANELLSEAYLSSNNLLAALSFVERLKRRTPRVNAVYQRIAFNQAVKKYNEDGFAEAVTFFDKSLSAPESRDLKYSAMYWRGESLVGMQRNAEAIDMYKKVLAATDKDAPSLPEYQQKSRYSLGYLYLSTNPSEANTYFNEYYQRGGSDGNADDALLRIADSYVAQGQYAQALKSYDKAYQTVKTNKDYALYQKGTVQLIVGDANGKKTLEDVVRIFPQSKYVENALRDLGDNEMSSENNEKAISYYSRLIMERPQSTMVPYAIMRRGSAFQNIQRTQSAISDYKYLLRNYINDPVFSAQAMAGLNELMDPSSPEYIEIKALYTKANPNDTSLRDKEFEKAKGLYFDDAYDKALVALGEYIRNYPESMDTPEAKFLLAETYYKLKNKMEALRGYYVVIADNKFKSMAKAYSKAAQIEFENNNFSKAITNFRGLQRAAIDVKDNQAAILGLMDSYFNTPKNDSTIYFSKQMLNLVDAPVANKTKAYYYMGKGYLQLGDLAMASNSFNQGVMLAKDDWAGECQVMLARMLYNQKKYKESSEMIMSKFNGEFSGVSYQVMGKAYLLLADDFIGLENYFQAKATLNSIIDKLPDENSVEQARVKLRSISNK